MEKIWTDGTTSGFGSQLEEIVTQGAMQGLPSKAMAARDCARAATLIFSKAPVCMYVYIYIETIHILMVYTSQCIVNLGMVYC